MWTLGVRLHDRFHEGVSEYAFSCDGMLGSVVCVCVSEGVCEGEGVCVCV